MGAWGNGLFDNDGAADVLAEINAAENDSACLAKIFDSTLLLFENFLQRDSEGLTFRPSTTEELAEGDRIIREALADLPQLLEQWNDDTEPFDASKILADTGDLEAQSAVAVAALVFASCGTITLPKPMNKLGDFVPNASLQQRSKSVLEKILSNTRLCKQFSGRWLNAVRKLSASVT